MAQDSYESLVQNFRRFAVLVRTFVRVFFILIRLVGMKLTIWIVSIKISSSSLAPEKSFPYIPALQVALKLIPNSLY